MIKAIILIIIVAIIIGSLWSSGISSMHEKHPDYKGDDLFDEDENTSI